MDRKFWSKVQLGWLILGLWGLLFLIAGWLIGWIFNQPTHQLSQNNQSNNRSFNQIGLPSHNQSPTLTLTWLAVGDIMLSRQVAVKIKKADDPLLPFRGLSDLLLSSDFNFGNLESPYSGSSYIPPVGSITFNAWPDSLVGLIKYKFNILNLANNHILDQGLNGLRYTKKILNQNNIATIGAGGAWAEAWQPAIIERNGIRLGFLGVSYSSLNDNGATTNNYVARWNKLEQLNKSIVQLKNQVDLVVVAMHGGLEYTSQPTAEQVKTAHSAIDAGADLVLGSHPHWVQTSEDYRGKKIYYSLGNFIFDQMWSTRTQQGLVLRITVTKPAEPDSWAVFSKFEEIPVLIKDYSTPYLVNKGQAW